MDRYERKGLKCVHFRPNIFGGALELARLVISSIKYRPHLAIIDFAVHLPPYVLHIVIDHWQGDAYREDGNN